MTTSRVLPPPDAVISTLQAATTRTLGRIEIYEQDGITRWTQDTLDRLIGGDVSVDYTRDERRILNLTLDNSDGVLNSAPGAFWYDKVIKVFKYVYVHGQAYDTWETQIGEFMIDSIDEDNFPHYSLIAGRDYTKRCLNSKFIVPTQFTGPNGLEDLINVLAANSGITKMILPATGIVVEQTSTYERAASRWSAMKELANAYNYDVFFDPEGYLRMELFADPATQTPVAVFLTGQSSNMVSYKKSTDDSRLYNHVLVVGAAPDADSLPTWAEAINNNSGSPTSVGEIGDRLYEYDSESIFQRHNLAEDPSATVAPGSSGRWAAWLADNAPGGGMATYSRQTSGGVDNGAFARVTFTTATSAVHGGVGQLNLTSSIPVGLPIAVRLHTRCSKSQRVAIRCDFWDKDDTLISTSVGTPKILAANTWTEMTKDGVVVPNGTAKTYVTVVAVPGTGGSTWAINDWIDCDQLLIEAASTPGEYFDGDMYACWWDKADHAHSTSTSNQQAQLVADSFLSIHQLQQYDLSFEAINLFFLDVGKVVEWDNPRPAPNDPKMFLLQSLSIPIGLGPMSAQAARVSNVGGT